ncbi:efflux RND transporter permease subunit [Azospirillum canadense]|uniref:efflux RND transporter permease subunit n=1 Tax=Azospirillum canadense TaxID=403962 RepID=UPI0022264CF7|nr:efflux RND transporter permease subunit [Azospirillum canadense]MCW2241217.1 multidrug efflux pump subunit AcrB [Azospirillum canadense]
MSRFNLSEWAVRNRAVVLFLILMSLVAGGFSYLNLGRAEDPSFTIKTMVVTAVWPGATADEMQRQVADPIETKIRTLPRLDWVQSYSRQNVTVVQVQLRDDTPPREVANLFYEIRKKIGDIRANLPQDLRGPFFNDEYSDVYAAVFMLTAPELPQADLLPYAERFRQRLLRIADVDKVEIVGERPRRIFVDISYTKLATLGIPASAIFQALQQQNGMVPAGSVDTPTERVTVKVDGAFADADAVADAPVAVNGRTFRIADVASVSRGYEDPPSFIALFNGEEALALSVRMKAGANGLALGKALDEAVRDIRATLPLGVDVHQATNQAEVIAEAVDEFLLKFVVAIGVVLLISFVALGLSAGVIVALSVPLTLAITFVVMEAAGMQFQRITLGSLILALGLLVDDAIIAIEMMLVKIEEGVDRVTAATFAWTSTAMPMLIGTLVTVAGFLPVGFARSTAGEYAGGIFWVLLIALSVSWIVAVLFTPYLGVTLLPRRLEERAAARGAHDPYHTPFYDRFRQAVDLVLRWRWAAIALTLLAFAAAGAAFTTVPKQFFPQSERHELLVELRGAEGSSFALSQAEVTKVESLLAGRPEIEHFATYIGQGAPRFYLALNPVLPDENFALLVIMTRGNKEREALRADLIRHFAAEEGLVRGRVLRLDFGPPTGHVVQFRVAGPDVGTVKSIAEKVRDVVRADENTRDVELQWSEQAKSVRFVLDQDRVKQLGLSTAEVAQMLQVVLSGAPATQLRENNRLTDVVIRAAAAERAGLDRLGDITITTRSGAAVPLSQIAHLEVAAEEPILWRRNGDVVLSVRSDVVDGVQGPDVTNAIVPRLKPIMDALPPGYHIDLGGAIEESAKANAALFKVLPVMFLIMLTLIMLQVRSFSRLFVVFLTFPLGFIGASFALAVTGKPFGFVALLGILALGGIIVRNTLILVDQIDTDMAHGLTMREAIIETTVRRARPVVLTALAAVLAFLPLTLTSFWGPMAIVLIGGTLVGTFLTLFFLPALYAAWFRVERAPGGASSPVIAAQAIAAE